MKTEKTQPLLDRRSFMKKLGLGAGSLLAMAIGFGIRQSEFRFSSSLNPAQKSRKQNSNSISEIYMSRNSTPEQNIARVIKAMGGIHRVVGLNDIVVLKPNAQWRGHGGTNTNTLKGFIELILAQPNFKGEIIIAENHHAAVDNSLGWTSRNRNGDYNLNELVDYFQEKGFANVTKYHWHDAGPNPAPLQFPGGNGRIVEGPHQGDGYVWTDEEYEHHGRKTKMTYPIFTSAYSGTTVDLKNGAWKNGNYTGQPVKFINFSTLNHHSSTFGVTASVKNYLGVVDMTCGVHGIKPAGYYNFHYVGLGWSKENHVGRMLERNLTSAYVQRFKLLMKVVRHFGPTSGATGGAVGHFMKTIRQADLNIIAAEYVGNEGRQEKPVHARTLLASVDPVALDYYAAKHVLLPLGGSQAKFNNPDWHAGPFRRILESCHAEGIGTLNEDQMIVHIC